MKITLSIYSRGSYVRASADCLAKISARKTSSTHNGKPALGTHSTLVATDLTPSSKAYDDHAATFRHALIGSFPLHRGKYPLLNDFEVNKGNSKCFVEGKRVFDGFDRRMTSVVSSTNNGLPFSDRYSQLLT